MAHGGVKHSKLFEELGYFVIIGIHTVRDGNVLILVY
jgi:hypothetical protein